MAVHVILGDVQHRRNRGMEPAGGLHHERRDLADRHVAGAHFRHRAGIGRADVAHHMGGAARVFEDFAQQRHRGGLAVGARHGQQKARRLAIGVLDLAHNLYAQRLGLFDRRMLHRNARADHQQIQPREMLLGVLFVQQQMCAALFQLVQRAVEILALFRIADPDLRAAQQEQLRRRNAAARHAQNHRLLNRHDFSLRLWILNESGGRKQPPVECRIMPQSPAETPGTAPP